MRAFSIDLSKKYSFLQGGELSCILTDCPLDGDAPFWKRPAVIVVPGGGYGMTSKREGEPIANAFLAKGYQVFILHYVCAPARYPEQLFEVAAAVDYVKANAGDFHVNPDEVFVVGFSAGGHLTGNLAVEHQDVSKMAGVSLNCTPTAVGLCYPVISREHGHIGSYDNLLNGYSEEEKAELLKKLNLNEYVSEQTPPAFIWATTEDDAVPSDNALRYALALDGKGILYELHIYPRGQHGLSTGDCEVSSTCPDRERVSRWTSDCAAFFRSFCEEKF